MHGNIRCYGVVRQLNSEYFFCEMRLAIAHEPLPLPK
jgi:hypothetical protein